MADLIDRQVFIKGQCNSCDGWCEDVNCDCLNCKCDCRCDFIKDLADEPSVDAVEVVHGYNTGRARWFECSVCGYGFNDIFLLDESDDMLEPKYCAHCGAKMDGERREENAAD